jgi:CheY-like chemotaxis protein
VNILFIEDNPDVYEPVGRLLERKGHSVKIINNADEAVLEIPDIKKYDVVVLDIMMMLGSIIKEDEACETGIAIYKRIRNVDEKIRIVILTALSKGEIWQYVNEDKNVYYQEKPIFASSDEFISKVSGHYNDR